MIPRWVVLGVIAIFILDLLAKFLVNPSIVVEVPSAEDTTELVEKNANRSIAIFSIVLVVIRFSLPNSTQAPVSASTEVAVGAFLLSASFLAISFAFELFAAHRIFLVNLQLTALRYAGLLLFSGTYFLLNSEPVTGPLAILVGASAAIGWVLWILHEIHYIFWIQRRKWDSRDTEEDSREAYVSAVLRDWFSRNFGSF